MRKGNTTFEDKIVWAIERAVFSAIQNFLKENREEILSFFSRNIFQKEGVG